MTNYNICAYSCRGANRKRNEDACGVNEMLLYGKNYGIIEQAISDTDLPTLITLADGMGGHRDGNIASRTALAHISQAFITARDEFTIEKTIVDTHIKLQAMDSGYLGTYSMGTTIVGALLKPDQCTFFNVGDSRIYLVRKDKIIQISVDDVSQNNFNPGMTQCLGGGITLTPKPHIKSCDILPGDVLVLASDGITDVVPDEIIMEIVSNRTPDDALHLCQEAVRRGGGDDTSLVKAEVC